MTATYYRVALNFCGSLILRIGDFLCFAGNNFFDCKRLFFLAGNLFMRFSGSRVQMELMPTFFVFYLSTCKRNTEKEHYSGSAVT